MKPTFLVLNIYKGQTFNDVLTFDNDDGTPINLSARSARMQARVDIADALPVLSLGTADATIALNSLGELSFNLSATDTSALPTGFEPTEWVYDLEWVLPNGVVERPIEGVIVVWPEVTR